MDSVPNVIDCREKTLFRVSGDMYLAENGDVSMTPAIVEKDGKLFLTAGSPAGTTIPTTVFQIIINVFDYNTNLKEAVDTGRFHHQWLPHLIYNEKKSIDTLILRELEDIGHKTRLRTAIGSENAVWISDDGEIKGSADKRCDN